MVNKAYAPLFGFSEINRAQVDKYADQYLQFLDLRLLTVVETAEGEPVAMGVGMGSLSHALQKAKGKLFPFGWWHLLKAIYLKRSKIIDLLLVAVLPEYQSKGVNAMLFADIIPIAKEMGFKWAEVIRSWRPTTRAKISGSTSTKWCTSAAAATKSRSKPDAPALLAPAR